MDDDVSIPLTVGRCFTAAYEANSSPHARLRPRVRFHLPCAARLLLVGGSAQCGFAIQLWWPAESSHGVALAVLASIASWCSRGAGAFTSFWLPVALGRLVQVVEEADVVTRREHGRPV